MADYYPLIARAVAGVDKNTAETRRALYERARTALLAQLRGVSPALSESDITRERLLLEEAIRKVEAEAVRQARVDATRIAPPPPPMPPPPRVERPAPPPAATPPPAEAKPAAPPPPESPPAAEPRSGGPVAEAGPKPPKPPRDPAPAATLSPPPEPRVSDLRAEPRAGTPRPEPRLNEPRPAAPPPARGAGTAFDLDSLPSGRLGSSPPPPSGDAEQEAGETVVRPRRSYRGLAIAAVLLLALIGAGAAVYWQLPNIVALTSRTPTPPPVRDAASPTRPKIDDRITPGGAADQARPAMPAGAAVAQRVVLYEEDPADPQGKRVVGSAIWRTETVSPGAGQPPDVVVKADIEVPERKMAMTFSFRRNTDQALPASHTAEVIFKLPADFPSGGVGNVPGILMKQSEQARGVPLAGVAVKVTNNYFLIALYSVDAEKERNIKLIKERSWFDIPIVYTNNRRAILAMEKGTPGERAFEDAFRAWGQ